VGAGSLGRACVALFVVSTLFPIAASLRVGRPPLRWLGIADVVIAACLVVVAMLVAARTRSSVLDRHRLTAYRIGQAVIGVSPILLATFLVVGQRLDWTVLVVGLAWRGWLLLYSLPFIVSALEEAQRQKS
jgi:hypothetical protein